MGSSRELGARPHTMQRLQNKPILPKLFDIKGRTVGFVRYHARLLADPWLRFLEKIAHGKTETTGDLFFYDQPNELPKQLPPPITRYIQRRFANPNLGFRPSFGLREILE